MLSDYLSLITSQHVTKPKYMAMLAAILQPVQDIQNCLGSFNAAFDINKATGAQLDILGARVGVARLLNFQPAGNISPLMDDDTYRTAIKAKIAQNQWDGTIPGIYDLWNNLFYPRLRLILHDNQDMTMTVFVLGDITPLEQQLIQNGYIIPKPEGVTLQFGTFDTPVFAFDENKGDYQGWDTGKWLKIN